jgi:hypothetical protein
MVMMAVVLKKIQYVVVRERAEAVAVGNFHSVVFMIRIFAMRIRKIVVPAPAG